MQPHHAAACSKPCKGCPFRKGGFVVRRFANRYNKELLGTGFICHQTKDLPDDKRLQCAGFIIFSDKIGKPSRHQFTAQWLFGETIEYSPQAQAVVFDTFQEFETHHAQNDFL